MSNDKSETKTTNPLINAILVFTVGLSALEISQLIFGSSQVAALTSLQFNQIFESMYTSMLLSADSLSTFWAVLVAWAISGMITTEIFSKALDYMLSEEYKYEVDNNEFGYPYNPVGYEFPFALKVFKDFDDKKYIRTCEPWISEQVSRSYNIETGIMGRNTDDPATLTARIYELCRLPANILKKINIKIPDA